MSKPLINKNVKENPISVLKTLDLSTKAAKVYLALLSNSEASASFLCNETGIPDSKIYYALNELAQKEMILVQRGTPNVFKALHPKEAINNLKQRLVERTNQRLAQADNLANSLSPIFESLEDTEEIELAYVIRGRRNIVKRIKDLIGSARTEVLVLVSEKELLDDLKPSLLEAKDKVQVGFAVSKNLLGVSDLRLLGLPRALKCYCNVVISDMRTLITVSSWKAEVAIMTNDKALVTMSAEYYENPRCCKSPNPREASSS